MGTGIALYCARKPVHPVGDQRVSCAEQDLVACCLTSRRTRRRSRGRLHLSRAPFCSVSLVAGCVQYNTTGAKGSGVLICSVGTCFLRRKEDPSRKPVAAAKKRIYIRALYFLLHSGFVCARVVFLRPTDLPSPHTLNCLERTSSATEIWSAGRIFVVALKTQLCHLLESAETHA